MPRALMLMEIRMIRRCVRLMFLILMSIFIRWRWNQRGDHCQIILRRSRRIFLSTNPITRQKLQLLGVSSMFIASKYVEITPPHVEDICYMTDNTYKKEEVIKMEADILKFLKFEMGNPTQSRHSSDDSTELLKMITKILIYNCISWTAI